MKALLKINSILIIILLLCSNCMAQENYSNERIANAIYYAEGGSRTAFPYGILKHYEHTTPRQACLNTIKHCRKLFAKQKIENDFICFLGNIYAPTHNCKNDPTGLNSNWISNVKYYLKKGV